MPTITSTDKASSATPFRVSRKGDELYAKYGDAHAHCTLKFDPNDPHRALVTDLYGDPKAWVALLDYLGRWADRHAVELSGWVDVTNKHVNSFWKRGFSPRAVLVRREPNGHH